MEPVGDDAGAGDGADPREAGWLEWKRTEVDGRVAVYGEAGEGPPVVFLHGWGLDHKAYKRALSRLVTAGVHVVAPALPGFGGTAALPGRAAALPDFVEWVDHFLDVVGVDEPALVMGHSFGGGIAIRFAHDHTDRTRALVLVNSIGGSAWTQKGSTMRSMAERPLWGLGHPPAGRHLPGPPGPQGAAGHRGRGPAQHAA